MHSTTQSSPDISRRNAITRAAMQNLDKQIWKSRISISTKLKLYNTCILPIFLYGSEWRAVTKKDVHKIDALDQWRLWKLLGIKWYQHVQNDEVRQTTGQPHLSATVQARRLSLCGHIVQMPDERRNRFQEDLASFHLGELEETTGTYHELKSNNQICAKNCPLWRLDVHI